MEAEYIKTGKIRDSNIRAKLEYFNLFKKGILTKIKTSKTRIAEITKNLSFILNIQAIKRKKVARIRLSLLVRTIFFFRNSSTSPFIPN